MSKAPCRRPRLNVDGTTLTQAEDNCEGRTATNSRGTKRFGEPGVTGESYIIGPSPLSCGYQITFYCVGQ